jgi:5-methylcytosine-specific restriction enzyme A
MPWNPEKPYANVRWRKESKAFLSHDPLCRDCAKRGRDVPATIVDHIIPHHGDYVLFWDQGNWQGLCATCHSSGKQRFEKSGRVMGCDLDGLPLDINHPWSSK